jgi:3-deoxy-D-manno-octulosonate 8-phosphate phosphatase (KDO 8-P phosphatase)
MNPPEIQLRASRIQLLLTDCDGVLTDGSLHYSDAGETVKVFHIHDGLGFKLARLAGLKTGIISGRQSAALELRARELQVDLNLLRRVGLAIAVADAVAEVKAVAHLVTQHNGGRGAFREAVELLLQAQNRWEELLTQFN